MKWLFLIGLTATAGLAQPLTVYTELAHLDESGKVLAPQTPREILSPALARNAFNSFQIAITVAKGEHWRLFVGQNPEKSASVTMYREAGDRLEPVKELPVEAEGPAVFWMDLWIAKDAPVARIKIEPQLNIHDDWVIYPVEGRVMEATVPDGPWPQGFDPPMEVMRELLCGGPGPAKKAVQAGAPSPDASMSRLRYRDAQQDLASALRAPRDDLKKVFGACSAPPPEDPEWYLRVRDYLLRLR